MGACLGTNGNEAALPLNTKQSSSSGGTMKPPSPQKDVPMPLVTSSKPIVNPISLIEPVFRDNINWTELEINFSKPKEAIIGDGSFGRVFKAVWSPAALTDKDFKNGKKVSDVNPAEIKIEVAVKVLTRSLAKARNDNEFNKVCKKAMKEVDMIRRAEERMIYKDCIIRTYGFAQGALPDDFTAVFKIPRGEEGVGIIMRLEKGGSLDEMIINSRKKIKVLSFVDKINILFQIARSVAELHAVGIVHADIKPENVLLNGDWPATVRLADFGFSNFNDLKSLGGTSLAKSKSFRGTPLYSAPEMLINPYTNAVDGKVAKASRKTDVYAFAMLTWELLAEGDLYPDVFSEPALCSRVHQGARPPLSQLPPETPWDIKYMLKACWSANRSKRLSAIECMAILQAVYLQMTSDRVDVVISRQDYPKEAIDQIYHYLTRAGLTVIYEDDEFARDPSISVEVDNAEKAANATEGTVISARRMASDTKIHPTYAVKIKRKITNADQLPPVLSDVLEFQDSSGSNESGDVDLDIDKLALAVQEFETKNELAIGASTEGDDEDESDGTREPPAAIETPSYFAVLKTTLQPLVDRVKK